jgi:hypothetical protein
MQQNKAMSWAAAVFVLSFASTLLAPVVYIMAVGKTEGSVSPSIFGIQLFEATSHKSGGFSMSYGVGAVIIPITASLIVWAVLQFVASKTKKQPTKQPK